MEIIDKVVNKKEMCKIQAKIDEIKKLDADIEKIRKKQKKLQDEIFELIEN